MEDIGKEIIKSIQVMIDKRLENYKADKTYKSVIKSINSNGYVILDSSGNERTVKCIIPNIELKISQSVWVKEPMGDIKNIHICGIV